jgi:diguanylate cyclase (GGDEF)-like protein/PAS domain S-box-containing protein
LPDNGFVNSHPDARTDALLRETERKLHRQNQVVVDLARHPSVQTGDLPQALREIAKAAAETLDVDRVSVWFFTNDRQALECREEYVAATGHHTAGGEVTVESSPVYFHVLESERTLSIHDTDKDSRTAPFTEEALRFSGARSALDASVRRLGRVVAVVRHTVIVRRQWTVEEEHFAASIADLVALTMDASEKREAQQSLQNRFDLERLLSSISTRLIDLGPGDLDDAITAALSSVGPFVGADEAYVLLVDEGGETASMKYEWCAPGVHERAPRVQRIPTSAFSWAPKTSESMQPVRIESSDRLPPHASAERALLEAFSVESLLALPVAVRKNLLGVFGIASLKRTAWDEEMIALLRIVANTLAGAMNRARSEQILRASEERYRVLFERNVAGVYRNTVDGKMLECNEAMARMLGYERPAEVMSHNAKDSYFDLREREEFIELVRRERSVSGVEVCLHRSDGRPLWLLESLHIIDGDPEILEGTAIDITDRKLAEMALHESESRYRTVIEQMREGLARVDNDGVFQFVNDRFCEMLGYTREELIGRKSDELLDSPDDIALIHEKTEAHRQGRSGKYELRVRRKDGWVLWVEVSGSPLLDADGRVAGSVCIYDDVTERRRTEEALRDSEMRYRLLADYSTDMISRIAARGTILYTSPAVMSLLGFQASDLAGRSIFDFMNPADREVVRLATLTLARRGTLTFSFRAVRRDGTEAWFEATCRGIKSPVTGKLMEIVAVSRDISERKRVEEHIEFQAYHDDLTGLPNRSLFRDRLTVALAYARRAVRPLALLFIDLDNFKTVNDTIGHAGGDALLKALAIRLISVTRAEDTIARVGGDEFTVLATNLSSPEDAALVAQKILEAISQPVTVDEHEFCVTASIGVAIYPEDGELVETLLTSADDAMYQAKASGRNVYKLCTPAMNRRAVERLSMDVALRRAIEHEEFSLHFQPLIRLDDMTTSGMEALLRWQSPDYGQLEPEQFLAIAEDTRMIVPLAAWTLRQACGRAAQWQATRPGVRLTVNLSPRQFQHNELQRMIVEALEESKLDPSLLELDITNGAAMLHNDRTISAMRSLRELGVLLAVDDFGTGQSSLTALHNLPIDAVKIDRAFVRGIEQSASDRAVICGVIVMARGLELRVTAEGVETQEQLDFLRSCGCEEAQGFFLGRGIRPDFGQ